MSYTWKNSVEVHHQDCLAFLGNLDDESVDLVYVDPPYNIDVKMGKKNNDIVENYQQWCNEWLRECHRVLKSSGTIYLSVAQDFQHHFKILLEEIGFRWLNDIIWQRSTLNYATKYYYAQMYEPTIFATKNHDNSHTFNLDDVKIPTLHGGTTMKGAGRFSNTGMLTVNDTKNPGDVWNITSASKQNEFVDFQGQKPEKLLERIIKASSNEQDLVVDCFVGSGTTAVVSAMLNRRFAGCELDAEHYKIAVERFKDKFESPLFGQQ